MRSAIARASAGSVVKPKSVTGMPARLTTSRASYSKNLICRTPCGAEDYTATLGGGWLRRWLSGAGAGQPVGLGQLGVLLGEHLGEVDHHLALLPRRVVLHLAVDHVYAAPVGDRLDHLLGEGDLVRVGRVDPLGDRDLPRVQRPLS